MQSINEVLFTNEIWKPISFSNILEVSNYGRVRNIETNTFKKLKLNYKGYPKVGIYVGNYKNKQFSVHRLVALAFIPNPENKPQVNHKDGIKTNNHVDNLEWCDNSENQIHAWKMGMQVTTKARQLSMEHASKIGREKNKKKVEGFVDGVLKYEFNSMTEASEQLNICISTISHCISGHRKSTNSNIENERIIWRLKC